MEIRRAFVIRSLAAAIAGFAMRAAALGEDEQWQCRAGPAGGWDCSAVALPPPVFSRAGRLASLQGEAPAAPAAEAAYQLAQTMDWVPREQLPASGKATLPAHCTGTYVEPPLEAAPTTSAVFGTIQASADESELQQSPEIARFTGNVTVRQDDRRLRANKATYYRAEDRIVIDGEVQYREPGLLVRAESAEFRTEQNAGKLATTRFVMHRQHARGEAAQVLRNPDSSIDLEDGSYTQCEPGADDWLLSAATIHIDRNTGQATARNATLRVRDVPVLYTPYIRFPVDDRRTSGILWPMFTNSSQNGLDVAVPYYFNLAPNYDATFVPRYMNDRGLMAGGELRYMNGWSNWVASGGMLPDDKVYGDRRWLASLQQVGLFSGSISTRINYTEVSDEEYLQNLGATGLEVKRATHLLQSGAAAWSPDGNWTVSARAQQYQLLDPALDEPYKMLPRIELSRSLTDEPFKPDYALYSEYTVFEHKDAARLTGQRLYLEPTASFPMEWAAAFVRPTVGYQSINYSLDDSYGTTGGESPSVAAPLFSVDSGYFLERETTLFGTQFQHTLEPRAFYLWVDRQDHSDIPNFDSQELTFSFSQLFRTTRFAGHDRIADANQASFSVTSRLVDEASGVELLSASIGQIRYFEDRRVTIANTAAAVQDDPDSAIAAELQIQPREGLAVTASTLWDPRDDQIDEGGLMVHWTPGVETIMNLGYRYRRDQPLIDQTGVVSIEDVDQVDFSTTLPLWQNWKLLARYQYDLTNDISLEETAGVEYSSCCWSLRVVYQEGVDWNQGRDSGLYLEFVLQGLGSLGKNLDQLLQKSIFGYGQLDRDLGPAY